MKLVDQVAKGVAWSTAEKVCSMLLQMVVSIVVARLLVPEDFGVMAILTFFTAVGVSSNHSLDQGPVNCFYKGPDVKYFRVCEPDGLCGDYSTLTQQQEGSRRLYANEGI